MLAHEFPDNEFTDGRIDQIVKSRTEFTKGSLTLDKCGTKLNNFKDKVDVKKCNVLIEYHCHAVKKYTFYIHNIISNINLLFAYFLFLHSYTKKLAYGMNNLFK